MPGSRKNFVVAAAALLLCTAIVSPVQAASQRTRKRAAKQVQVTPTPQVPSGPLTPLTLEEIPSSPPQVSYRNEQLTITAQNSTLSDILRAVHEQTGAIVETPGKPSDRVMGRFGPGPARDVLASLLNGSHFDYVMLGSSSNPTAVAHVILTAKSGGANVPPVQQANANQPQGPPQPEADVTNEVGTDDFASADEEPEADIPADQPVAEDQQQPPQQLPNGQIMRSPEQLLQELQQRQLQQQQQQQQQQNGGAPTPAAPQGFPIPPGQQPEQQEQPPQ